MLSPAEVARLRVALDPILEATPVGRNPFEGFYTRRVYSPLAKTRALDDLVLSPWLEQLSAGLIGPHTLSSIIGIQIGPGEVAQEIHYDAAAYPLPRTYREVVFNTMWALDDFTAENGATVLYPGSNHSPDSTPPPDAEPVQAIHAGRIGTHLARQDLPRRRREPHRPVAPRPRHRVRGRMASHP